MALPDVTLTIQDFALGLVPPNTANATVKLGIAAGGLRNQLSSGFNDPQTLKTAFGAGPIVEAGVHLLGVAGGPVYLMPVTPASFSAGAPFLMTLTGTGAGTINIHPAVWRKTKIRYTLGGALATAKFQISIDDGLTYLPTEYTTAATTVLDHTLTQITMSAGTYVIGDTATFNTDGTVSTTGTSPAPTTAATQSAPVDEYEVRVRIMVAGALGVAQFQYSLDGGDTFSASTLVPGGGNFVVPNAGFRLVFASTFVKDDLYARNLDTAGYTTTELNTALDALLANSTEWGHVHVQGEVANAAAAKGVSDAVETKMQLAQTQFRYVFALTECPSSETDSTISTAFASAAYLRTGVCVGDLELVSGVDGRIYRRNAAWTVSARIALVPVGEDLAFVGRGPLPGVASLYRNEFVTQALDEARFNTLRTHIGIQGFYITNGRIMTAAGSDFTFIQFRRVMDVACKTTRQGLLPYLNSSLRVDPATGKINEKDAQQIEARVKSQLVAVLVSTGQASDAKIVINRDANILSTLTLPVDVRIIPLGYAKFITVTIGFENPSLAA